MERMNVGLVGVGVMGQNLVLNMERHGYSVAVYDRAGEKVRDFLGGKARGKKIAAADDNAHLAAQLEQPRKIFLMVNAGKPVDDVIASLRPHLTRGDIIVDAGNSWFLDTERRAKDLASDGIFFIGSGVSGGEAGALNGPSIMPGGAREAYDHIAPIVTSIAAQVGNEPCCAYMGPGGAGHYVKMVHNGIEYAIMQVICEIYDIMKRVYGFNPARAAEAFHSWNAAELNSYLLEITSKVLTQLDPETRQPLIDLILDTAEQKGTGKWTSQNAFDLGVPIPTIDMAVEARIISGHKEQRVGASRKLAGPSASDGKEKPQLDGLRDALHASMIVSYAQGMALLKAASDEYKYDLHCDEIAAIWRGGCIIRAKMLDAIRNELRADRSLSNLMLSGGFSAILGRCQQAWRATVGLAVTHGIPTMAMSASLNYYDAYRSERLPANLLQAQRDYFGAHTYHRLDREGVFHTHWEE